MAEEPGYVSLLYHSDGGSAAAAHVQRGRDVCKFMEEFWRRYTAIEQAYARGLAALVDHSCASFQPDGFFARMFAPSLEECGELADAWAALRLSLRETAAAHHTIAESVAREVSQPLAHYLDSTEVELRQVTDMGKSQNQALQAQKKTVKALAKQVAKLHVQCAKLKKQSQNQTLAYDKRQKVDLALSTSQTEVKLLEESYKREVQSARSAQQTAYLSKMPNALFSLQQLEEKRIEVVQQSLYKYAAIFQASIPKSRAAVEAVAYAADRVHQKKLVHDFVKGTMLAKPEAKAPTAPRYVAFGELDPSTEIVDEEVDEVLFSDMQAKQFMFERMEKELMEEMKAAAEALASGPERGRRKRSQSSKQKSLVTIPRRSRSSSTKAGKDKPLPSVEGQEPTAVKASVREKNEAAEKKESAQRSEPPLLRTAESATSAPVAAVGERAPNKGTAGGKEGESPSGGTEAMPLVSEVAVSELQQSKSEATLVRKRGSRAAVLEAASDGLPLSQSTGSCKKEASIGWIDDILSTPAPDKAPATAVDPFDAIIEKTVPRKKKRSVKNAVPSWDGPGGAADGALESARIAKEKEEQRRKEVEEQLQRERERESLELEQEKKAAEAKAKEKLRKKREEKAAKAAAQAAAEAEAEAEEARQREQAKKEVEFVAELDDTSKRMLAELENTVEQNDYYKLFEVEPTAELKHITRMRRELHKRYHPDNFSGNPAAKSVAISTMMTINEVFTNVFKNPQARELYDKLCLYRAEYANLLKTADPMLQRAATNLSILAKALRKANMPAALNTEVQQVLVVIKKSRGISP